MGRETTDARKIVKVAASDRRRAIETIVMAFGADPVIRWFYSEPWRYLTHYGDFVETFGGQAFGEGSAWTLGNFDATAIWLSPASKLDDDAIVKHLESTVAPENIGDLLEVLGQMDAGHPPMPHWYLAWLGVDAAMQGRGFGDELMAQCLQVIDTDNAPAYLDNTNPANVPFYERHGFRVVGESQAGACPPLIGMLRDARLDDDEHP
jgi:ribosomal protein S18 acetylase RimI-like enzyme